MARGNDAEQYLVVARGCATKATSKQGTQVPEPAQIT